MPFILFYFYTSLTALMYINRDSFFNFGNPDDYNRMGFKYPTFSITTYVSGDSFFYFGIPDDCPELNSTIGISSS